MLERLDYAGRQLLHLGGVALVPSDLASGLGHLPAWQGRVTRNVKLGRDITAGTPLGLEDAEKVQELADGAGAILVHRSMLGPLQEEHRAAVETAEAEAKAAEEAAEQARLDEETAAELAAADLSSDEPVEVADEGSDPAPDPPAGKKGSKKK